MLAIVLMHRHLALVDKIGHPISGYIKAEVGNPGHGGAGFRRENMHGLKYTHRNCRQPKLRIKQALKKLRLQGCATLLCMPQ